jgi:tRNA-2-methylthio-N6-dimethylallyladenosine synthase
MNRKYTREWYLDRIDKIRSMIPDCAISTDIICGFSGETDDDHIQTVNLMKTAHFDYAFMFKYSVREGTAAAIKYIDDVDEKIKSLRLREIIALQQELSHKSNMDDIGKTFDVLTEGVSKKSSGEMMGRNSQNKVVVYKGFNTLRGDYVRVKIISCTSATLLGEIVS